MIETNVEDPAPKKRSKSKSPTARTLDELRKRGIPAQVVERWNQYARVRVDLFGCIDIVALTEEGILGIQATSNNGGTHAARRAKILAEPRMRKWVDAGGRLEIWSWSKKASGRWELRCEDMTNTLRALAACVEARSDA